MSNIQQIYSYSERSLKYRNGFSEQEYFGYFLLMLDLPANVASPYVRNIQARIQDF